MKYILLTFIFLHVSCSHKVKGRFETNIAKKNFLSAGDLNYLKKNYDWEITYNNRAKAYAQRLASTQEKEEAIDKLSKAEIKSILNDAFLESIENKGYSDEEILKRAKLTEKLYQSLSKASISSEAELAEVISLFMNNQEGISSEMRIAIYSNAQKIAEFLKYSNNYREMDIQRVPASISGTDESDDDKDDKDDEDDEDDDDQESITAQALNKKTKGDTAQEIFNVGLVNDDKIEFQKLNEIDYVKVLISPTEYETAIRGAVLELDTITDKLSVRDLELVSNIYMKMVTEISFVNQSRLKQVQNNVAVYVRTGNIVNSKKLDAVNELLEKVHEHTQKLLVGRIEKKIINYKLKSKKYAKLNSDEIKFQLQNAFARKSFNDLDLAKSGAKVIHKELTRYSLYNDGLTQKQFDYVFNKIKRQSVDSEVLSYYENHLRDYIERSKKFKNFRKVASRFDDSDQGFVIDELPSELKHVLDRENVYLLSLSLKEKRALDSTKDKMSFSDELIKLAKNKMRKPASIQKESVFKIHGIGENGLLISGQKLAFILASKIATPETLRALMALGVDINEQDERGYSPLMVAIENSRLENIKTLKKLGADTKLKTNEGLSLLDIALNTKNEDVIDTVRKFVLD